MLQYQMSMALADLHIRDLLADARRHELVAAARRDHRDPAETPSHAKGLAHVNAIISALLSLVRVRQGTRTSPTKAPASAAGPMGCRA